MLKLFRRPFDSRVAEQGHVSPVWGVSNDPYVSRRAARSLGVDLGVLVDRTGSSASFSKGVVVATETILRIVENKLPDSRAWVQTHGDEDYGEFPELLVGPGLMERAVSAVRSIHFEGGGDGAETHLSGIEAAIGHLGLFAAESDRRQAMLVFLTDDTKPAKSGHTAEAIGSRLKQAGVLFYLICQPTPELRKLCTAADGLCFEISNNPSEEMLQAIASQIAGSVTYSVSTRSARPVSPPEGFLPAPTAGPGGGASVRKLPGR